MKIAFMHFRVYETDGVSLEMDKWRLQLDKLGHETMYISGSEGKDNDVYVEELDYRSEYNNLIHKNAFKELEDFDTKDDLLAFINSKADSIFNKLKTIVEVNNIDLLIPNNVTSLGHNLPVGLAVGKLALYDVVDIMYHHHDFYWEREKYEKPLFNEIKEMLFEYFPFQYNAKHCVINEIAKRELLQRKGLIANVVPNVFDYQQPSWEVDEYNNDLRSKLGIKDTDIVFLQATRIVERKAIELGYRIVEELNELLKDYDGVRLYNGHRISSDTKVHFVLAGLNELNDRKFHELDKLLKSGNVEIHYINDIVDHSRDTRDGKKVYSLWDVYTMCDFITYTSILEGWGNQLLEGLFAKKPMLVYEYPVFKTDIKQYKFNLITIDHELTRDAETLLYEIPETLTKKKAAEILALLLNKEKYLRGVQQNFNLAKQHVSYESLYEKLKKLIGPKK